jgi:hypothetical protein
MPSVRIRRFYFGTHLQIMTVCREEEKIKETTSTLTRSGVGNTVFVQTGSLNQRKRCLNYSEQSEFV